LAGYGTYYWAERTASTRRRTYPSFRGQLTADVVVIGGGLTGCTAAHVFANAGLKTILVDAGRLASGSTAGSIGALIPQPDAWFRTVEAAAGLRVARAAWKASRRSALEFSSALSRLNIKCDLTPQPLVINARAAPDVDRLRREQAARKAAGLDAPWLSGAATAAETGTDSAGAIRLSDGFVFDPVRAALGLAASAAAKGAAIFEKSAVRRTRFTRKHADVILTTGTVRTQNVFVATGGPGALFSQLRRHVREQAGYVVVTDTLPAAVRREVGRRGSVVTEASDVAPWLRWMSEDRVLFAGGLSAAPGTRQRDKAVVRHTADLMYELSVRHPAISGLPAAWGWTIPVVSTPDGLPWIGSHRNYPFHFFAMAFGWHGDGLAWFAAKAALRAFADESTSEDHALGFLR